MQGDQEGALLGRLHQVVPARGGNPGQWSRSLSIGVRSISHSHKELREPGGGPSGGVYRIGGTGVPTLEWIFFRTCLQGLNLTMG